MLGDQAWATPNGGNYDDGDYGQAWGDDPPRRRRNGSKNSGKSSESSDVAKPARKGDEGGNLFVDPEEMKRKVRENLMKPAYDVATYYHETGMFRTIATSPVFEKITLGVIGMNAIWIGVDTDHNNADTLLQALPVFQVAEHIFCVFFSFEWTVRFCSFKRKRDGLRDAWFVFDSALVFMMVGETWILTVIMLGSGAGGSGGLGNASILRMARLARLSRMARMARLLRAMPELMILIKGIVAATRSVFFTLALLCLLTYVFAIAFTQLTVESDVGEEYFDKVPKSMYTLMVYGTLMDGIGAVLNKLGAEHFVFGALFLLFVLLAALTLMNMLIGVLTEVVSAVAATEKETLTVTFVRNKMQDVLKQIDNDGDGNITKNEFVKIVANKDASEALAEVDVDVIGLVDFADFIFADEDGIGTDKALDFQKFMDVVLQFRGSNNATVKDIVNLRKFVTKSMKDQRHELQELRDLVHHTKAHMERRGSDPGMKMSRSHSNASKYFSGNQSAYHSEEPKSPKSPKSPRYTSEPRSVKEPTPREEKASPAEEKSPVSNGQKPLSPEVAPASVDIEDGANNKVEARTGVFGIMVTPPCSPRGGDEVLRHVAGGGDGPSEQEPPRPRFCPLPPSSPAPPCTAEAFPPLPPSSPAPALPPLSPAPSSMAEAIKLAPPIEPPVLPGDPPMPSFGDRKPPPEPERKPPQEPECQAPPVPPTLPFAAAARPLCFGFAAPERDAAPEIAATSPPLPGFLVNDVPEGDALTQGPPVVAENSVRRKCALPRLAGLMPPPVA